MEELKVKKRRVKSSLIQQGKMDITFFGLVTVLLTVGLIMLFSAGYAYSYAYFGNSYRFISKQAIFAVIGFAGMLFFSKIDYHVYRKFSWIVYGISVVLLSVMLILPPMIEDVEYKRWFAIGSFSFQPSEIAKFGIILLFSHLISANYKAMKKFTFGITLHILLKVLLIPVMFVRI